MDKLSVKEYEDPFKGQPVIQTPIKGRRRVKGIVAWTKWKPASLGAGRYCPFIGASKPPVWRVVMIFAINYLKYVWIANFGTEYNREPLPWAVGK